MRFMTIAKRARECAIVSVRPVTSRTGMRLVYRLPGPSTITSAARIASRASGRARASSARGVIRRVRLQPENARALPEAREAILAADVIVLGPGSLYTSLIPVLLVTGLTETIAHSRARFAIVMNLMTEPGETDGYTAADHILAIRRHVRHVPIHDVLLSTTPVSDTLVEYYAAAGAAPVPLDMELLRALGSRPVARDLLGVGPLARHDPHKLAR